MNLLRFYFLHCRSSYYRFGVLVPKEAELIAFLESLYWIRDLGCIKVIFELDCRDVVTSITSKGVDLTEFGALVSQYRTMLDGAIENMISKLGVLRDKRIKWLS